MRNWPLPLPQSSRTTFLGAAAEAPLVFRLHVLKSPPISRSSVTRFFPSMPRRSWNFAGMPDPKSRTLPVSVLSRSTPFVTSTFEL